MNVRKPVDYGTMHRELTASLTQNLLQMDEVVRNVHPDNDLFEKVFCKLQRIKFRGSLFLSIHSESRLDIELAVGVVDNKNDFLLCVGTLCPICYDPDVYRVSPSQKLIVNEIFHDMTGIILPVIQARIPKTDIGIVILVRIGGSTGSGKSVLLKLLLLRCCTW